MAIALGDALASPQLRAGRRGEGEAGPLSDETSRDRIRSGKSWDEFCDALESAGKTVLAEGAPDDLLDRSEGFRYLDFPS